MCRALSSSALPRMRLPRAPATAQAVPSAWRPPVCCQLLVFRDQDACGVPGDLLDSRSAPWRFPHGSQDPEGSRAPASLSIRFVDVGETTCSVLGPVEGGVRAHGGLESLPWAVGPGGQQLDSPALRDLGSRWDTLPRPASAKPSSGEDPAAPMPGLCHL